MKTTLRILALMMVAVLLVGALAACAPNKDPDKAVEALKKNGYTAGKTGGNVSNAVSALFGGEADIDCYVSGMKTVTKDGKDEVVAVSIVYYKTTDAAKEAYKSLKEEYDKEKEKDADSVKDITIGRSGKMVYSGNKEAVKAAH